MADRTHWRKPLAGCIGIDAVQAGKPYLLVSFVDYEQLVLGMDAICDKNSRLETELVKAKKKIAELENNSR